MRHSGLRSALVLSCLLVCIAGSSCQRTGRWSKEWEEKFESFQPSGIIMETMGISQGMAVGEIGAGNGRFAVKVADRIGQEGKVYANDIDSKAINFMRRRCRREHISNMFVVEGEPTNPYFPQGELDLIYIVNTYHEIGDPVTLMRNAAPALTPDGRLVIIEIDPAKLEQPHSHCTPREIVISQAHKAGYVLQRIETLLPIDNIYFFRVAHRERIDEV